MKKHNRILSIMLILAMCFGMLAVSATAAGPGGGPSAFVVNVTDFSDYEDIANKDEVAVLMRLGIISGMDDGSFDPSGDVTRAQMAKMIATAILGGEEPAATNDFTDASNHWASAYIGYCVDNGLVDGMGDGTFGVNDNVTGLQAAKMLLVGLGVSGEFTGENWAANVQAAADELNLFAGISDPAAALSRDEAALLVYNALMLSDGTGVLPQVVVISEATPVEEIPEGATCVGAGGALLSLLVDGQVYDQDAFAELESYESAVIVPTEAIDNPSSFTGGGTSSEDNDYAFRPGIYINNNEIVEESSVLDTTGMSAAEIANVSIIAQDDDFNPIIVRDSEVVLSGVTISNMTDSDGSKTCDFSGLGAALAVYGDSMVTLEDSTIEVSGVANLAIFADDGADVIVRNSKLYSGGGTMYADYQNSPSQDTMVAPPWILGIMGTSRATNLMGTDSSTTVIDSTVQSAQWAILSTDSGTNMKLNVVNTTMELVGADYDLQETNSDGTTLYQSENPYTSRSGYGTYAIGDADEWFYGVDMSVGTYATIFTGGKGTYTAMKAGEPIELYDANGNVLTTYTPEEDKVTTINSDTFGFMAHQGQNTCTIEEGTVVNSNYTSFLIKTGCSIDLYVTSGATLNPGNGILVQVMDNDDSTTGMNVETFSFNTVHTEEAGWPTESTAEPNASVSNINISDTELTGDIFNGSGYYEQSATPIAVNLGEGGVLNGAIAATSCIHVNENYNTDMTEEEALACQNTSFTISEYYYIGQVANKIYFNGNNTIAVNLAAGSTWNVTGESLITSLTVAEGATLNGDVYIDGELVEVVPGTTYEGEITVMPAGVAPATEEAPAEEAAAPAEEAPAEEPVAEVEEPVVETPEA